MARLVTSGFELQDNPSTATTAPDGKRAGSPVLAFDSSRFRSGAVSAKLDVSLGSTPTIQWTFAAVTLGANVFARTYIYVPTGSLPVTGNIILLGFGDAVSITSGVALETNGTLTLQASIASTFGPQGSPSGTLVLDAWNMVELRANYGTGSVDQVEARLEGASFASASGLNITDSQIVSLFVGNAGSVGTSATAGVIYFDDVAVNDATGAAQTSWPGSGKVVLLRPTADSAAGTGWTLGNTTATGGNAWSRLDDAPPNSAADLTTAADADQIRNATSNANVNYDATMTTYTAAGVGAADTVNVLVPIVATGAPVVTSAKAGTVGVASNPTITNVALGAAGTAGAFWQGNAIGSYPTGNKWSFGTATYAPSVTVGTAPVMRVTQVTASTRIAVVSEMGIYVDYTPLVLPPPDLAMGLRVT